MELTGFPIWQIEYEGGEYPKSENHLELAQQFVATHNVTSITFFVTVMFTDPGQGGFEREFNHLKLTKKEMQSLTLEWVKARMQEAEKSANQHLDSR